MQGPTSYSTVVHRTYEKLNDKEIPVYYSWLPDYERWVAPEYSKHLEKIILIRNQYVNEETGSIFCRSAGLTEPDLNSPYQQLDLELKNDQSLIFAFMKHGMGCNAEATINTIFTGNLRTTSIR